jgi:acid phosphatase type 7
MRYLYVFILLLLVSVCLYSTDMQPYLQTPTATSMYVCWWGSSAVESTVQYGTSSALGLSATGNVYAYNSEYRWHFVKLENLQPNTRYYYKCLTGNQVSTVNSFTTTVAPGTTDGHLRLIFLGDTRTNTSDVENLVTAIQAKCLELYGEDWRQKINLICHVGDLVTWAGSLSGFINQFFNPFTPLSSSIPIMIAAGNHEGEDDNFYNEMETTDFAGPEGKKYYSFNLANSKFIFMNSNISGNTQLNWVQSKLVEANEDNDVDFVFGVLHHYGHSELRPSDNTSWVQNSIIPAFGSIPKASMLSYGHAHCFERGTNPINRTRLLLCGGGGAPQDRWGDEAQIDYPEVHVALDYWMYTLVDIDLTTHHYEAKVFSLGNPDVPLNNVLIDSWSQSTEPVLYQARAVSAKAPTGGQIKLVSAPVFPYSNFNLMTSQVQVSSNSSFSTNIIDSSRNWEDIYDNTGEPDYTPIDVNLGIDLKRYMITSSSILEGQTYYWRIRYRSQNADWGDWSSPQQFTYNTFPIEADFVYSDVNNINIPIQFTDTSVGNPTAWAWDFNNDGTPESTVQDPVWTFSTNGTQHVTLKVTINGQLYTTTHDILTGVQNADQESPIIISNFHIFPNPSYGSSNISFILKKSSIVRLAVYNLRGELVKSLSSNVLPIGINNVVWDGMTDRDKKVSSGIYIVLITTETGAVSRKTVLMR